MNKLSKLFGVFILMIAGFLAYPLYANVVITSDGKVATVVGSTHTEVNTPPKPTKEQIMLDRIAILEKAQNSTDPDILAMAEQVRADIANEKVDMEKKRNNPIWWWTKKVLMVISMIVLVIVVLIFATFLLIGLSSLLINFKEKKFGKH